MKTSIINRIKLKEFVRHKLRIYGEKFVIGERQAKMEDGMEELNATG